MTDSINYIYTLLNKYWQCETSLEEEKQLRDFFSEADIPGEMKQYAPLFTYLNEEHLIIPGDDFDEKLMSTIQQTKRERKYITIRIFAPLLKVVASILLIMGVGVSVFFISKQSNKPHFSETYHDPNIAIKDATHALTMVYNAFQTSEEASLQAIRHIEGLDINWTQIDSLRNISQQDITGNFNTPEDSGKMEITDLKKQKEVIYE